jgi:hypothetical protein
MGLLELNARLRNWLQSGASFVWSLADQVVASAGNALLLIELARRLSTSSFGTTSFTYTTTLLGLTLIRSLTSDVVMSAPRDENGRVRDRILRTPTYVVALITVLLGALAIVSLPTPEVGLMVVALGVIIVQDRLRYEWVCRKAMRQAFAMDFAWLAVQLVIVALSSGGIASPSPVTAISAWTIGALASLVFAKRTPRKKSGDSFRAWFRENKSRASLSSGQTVVLSASVYTPTALFALLHQPRWLGAYVVANSITGIQPRVSNAIKPLAYRRFADDQSSHGGAPLVRLSTLVGFASAVGGGLSVAIMAVFGHSLYGQAAILGLALSVWIAVAQLIGTWSTMLTGIIRARDRWGFSFGGELATTVSTVALLVGAAFLGGPGWITPFQVVGAALSLGIWYALYRRVRSSNSHE